MLAGNSNQVIALLSGATSAPTTGTAVAVGNTTYSFQAVVAGTGAVSATVVIEVSNDGTNFMTLGTITLSGTTSATDGFTSKDTYSQRRARLTAISGTGATVNVNMGV